MVMETDFHKFLNKDSLVTSTLCFALWVIKIFDCTICFSFNTSQLIACETCVIIGFNIFSLVTCNLWFTNSNLGFGFAMSNSLDKLHIGNSCSQSFHLLFQGQPPGFLFCIHLIMFYFHPSLPFFFQPVFLLFQDPLD